ncbi:hypothetical protein B0T20DRAFT_411159 [Sordaria brevicollis]|uniref:Proteinase inhibitor I78 n=1 Tax=Sordaria brevicollis TaxID=83679 RepID=A0AAE0UC94_SORBR|nr:hypothetical protein B0T20DRAFT_411159 [Sordaria brevicollis]
MPLVVPGVTTNDPEVSKTSEWMDKLCGKTLGDEHSETTFCKKDLPEQTRVIKPGTMVTKDFNPDRLNVNVDDEGKVSHVYHG